MTTVNVTAVSNTVTVTDGDAGTTVVTIPVTSVVTALTEGPQGPTGAPGPPKSITIAQPQANDQFTLFYTQQATTLTQVVAVVRGSNSPSATFELRYGADRSAAGTAATIGQAITNTTTGQLVTIHNMPIPTDTFLWIVISAISGQVEELSVCVEL
jgi:hypothetical protein